MNRMLLAAAAAATSAFLAGPALALTITTGGVADANGDPTSARTGAIVETFDADGLPPAGWAFDQSWGWTASGPLNVVSGSLSGQYAQPWDDMTHYYSSADTSSGWAQVDFGADYDYLGLYWGSIDTYNRIELFDDGALVGSILGLDAKNPANGDQGPNGSTYINIADVVFDTARFVSTNFAFEFDNLAVASSATTQVPEPATLGLLGLGLLGLGVAARRRRTV